MYYSLKIAAMNEISCEELKKKIDQKDSFKLVNCLSKAKFEMKHIAGSLNFPLTPDKLEDIPGLEKEIKSFFTFDDDIAVYCTDTNCQASIFIYHKMDSLGFNNIKRFSGGLRAWEEDGYKCVGTSAENLVN